MLWNTADTGEVIIIKKAKPAITKQILRAAAKIRTVSLLTRTTESSASARHRPRPCLAGSLFGWEVPGADPKNYDMEGNFINREGRDRGDAR
jgi:hypothetical protein